MATNTATANTKGGLFGDSAGLTQLTSISGKAFTRTFAAKLLGTKQQLALRRLMFVLTGAASGSTATVNFPQVEANVELGGKRNISTQVLINRASTAADVTEIKNDILALSTRTTFGASPPPDKDGSPLGEKR